MFARVASRPVPACRSFRALPGPRRASSKSRRGSAGSRHRLEMGSWAVPELCLPGVGSPIADPTGQFRRFTRCSTTSRSCEFSRGGRFGRRLSTSTPASIPTRSCPSSDLPTSGAERDRILDRVSREIGSVESEQYLYGLTLETVGPPGRVQLDHCGGHGQHRGDVPPLGAGSAGPWWTWPISSLASSRKRAA